MERMPEVTRGPAPERPFEGRYLDWPAIFGGAVRTVANKKQGCIKGEMKP